MGILLWFDVCWRYGVVWLGWCGIHMQAEALVPQPLFFRSLLLCVGILLWFDVCWRYGVVRLGWCGILMQAEALVPQPQHVSNASTFVFRSLRLCVGILLWFDVFWRYGVVRLGGVVSICRLRH